MSQDQNFSVNGFRAHVHGNRSDKGKRHYYPTTRRNWVLGTSENLKLNHKTAKGKGMKHKASSEVRKYWREQKRKAKK